MVKITISEICIEIDLVFHGKKASEKPLVYYRVRGGEDKRVIVR